FIIPVIPVNTWIEWSLGNSGNAELNLVFTEGIKGNIDPESSINFNWEWILLVGYSFITNLLLTKFIYNIFRIWQKTRNHKIMPFQNAKLVLLPEKILP